MKKLSFFSILPTAITTAMLCMVWPVAAQQYADLDRPEWKEDAVPPPPAYSLRGLIDVEMPAASSVKMGLDPDTISINQETGIVRYVVIARGPSAVNAIYEGMRCATGEYRVYSRKTQDTEWTPSTSSEWKSMRGQVTYPHPYRLARDGICIGTGTNQTKDAMVRALKSPKGTLYND
ncbi:MAG: hypothetical protein I8H77_06110 [Comamonadaceae bacterium]|nr:hypothetical protein [Comamonadaceae bacterium]